MIAHSCWFGSGFIYARLNLNQYIEGWAKKEGVMGSQGVREMLMPFVFDQLVQLRIHKNTQLYRIWV